jgi:hypothetical protein
MYILTYKFRVLSLRLNTKFYTRIMYKIKNTEKQYLIKYNNIKNLSINYLHADFFFNLYIITTLIG